MGHRGKHTTVWLDGYDLSVESQNLAFAVAYDELEESGYNQDHSTVRGQGNSDVTFDAYYGGIAGDMHAALNSIADSDTLVSLGFGENAIAVAGDNSFSGVFQQLNYDLSPNKSDLIVANINIKTRGGVVGEFGVLLDLQTGVSANGDGTSIDQTSQTTNGAVGYCHITKVSAGDTLTVKIQDSSDDAAFSDLIPFTLDGSAVAAERLTVAGTVDRYVRVNWVVTGSAIDFDFAVVFIRK